MPKQLDAVRPYLRSWGAYALGPLVALGTAPLIARALGPTDRGILAAVQQPMIVADAFAAAGLPAAVTYFVARGSEPSITLARARLIFIPTALFVGAALLAWAIYLDQRGILAWQLSVLPWITMVPLGAYIAARRGAWQGLGRYKQLDLERIIAPSVRLLFIVVLFMLAVGAPGPYIFAYCLANLTATAVLFIRFPIEPAARALEVRSSAIARFSLASAGGTIAVALNLRLDQAILPAFISLTDLGIYSVAVAVSEVPNIFIDVLKRNLLTDAAAGESRRGLMKACVVGGGVAVLACAFMASVAPFAVPIVFGSSFAAAVVPIGILSLATAISTVGLAGTAILAGRGHPGAASMGHGVGAGVLAVLFWYFREGMTLNDACWIGVASQASVALVTLMAAISIILRNRRVRIHVSQNRSGIL